MSCKITRAHVCKEWVGGGKVLSHVLPKMSLCSMCDDQTSLCTTYTVELVLRSIVTTHTYVLPNKFHRKGSCMRGNLERNSTSPQHSFQHFFIALFSNASLQHSSETLIYNTSQQHPSPTSLSNPTLLYNTLLHHFSTRLFPTLPYWPLFSKMQSLRPPKHTSKEQHEVHKLTIPLTITCEQLWLRSVLVATK